ncbi:MAG: hypothetical protein JO279_00150 [Verrucomicrobia bacterium]|nr:hypothetical protein [Verrucomicrobiota bacterium]
MRNKWHEIFDTLLPPGDTVYAVKSDAFQPGGAYSASDNDGILGKVDLSTGLVTPVVTEMKSPHGALFVPAFSELVFSCRAKSAPSVLSPK